MIPNLYQKIYNKQCRQIKLELHSLNYFHQSCIQMKLKLLHKCLLDLLYHLKVQCKLLLIYLKLLSYLNIKLF
ncbi:MAG: hypothetical protein CMG85_18930 [Marinobacter sp.]|nr:hypothetical protein [Marinobacter sp.]